MCDFVNSQWNDVGCDNIFNIWVKFFQMSDILTLSWDALYLSSWNSKLQYAVYYYSLQALTLGNYSKIEPTYSLWNLVFMHLLNVDGVRRGCQRPYNWFGLRCPAPSLFPKWWLFIGIFWHLYVVEIRESLGLYFSLWEGREISLVQCWLVKVIIFLHVTR